MAEKPQRKFIFNFESLKKTFAALCPDFREEPSYEEATISRRFAEMVIFTYSKEAKAAKAQHRDVSWTMQLKVTNDKGAAVKSEVKVQTHFVREPPQHQPFILRGHLLLSFKQASLLAVEKYCQLVPHQVRRGEIILTPLAGALFNKENLPSLAKAVQEPLADVVVAVIASCQTDGFYLEHSRCHIALLALIRTVADLKMRASLVKKTIKMYNLQGKQLQLDKLQEWSRFLREAEPRLRPQKSQDDEFDKLASQVLAITGEQSRVPAPAEEKKLSMKCAANFQGSKPAVGKP
ncbi:hypothetical protein KR018_007715 [Drosophila ironensis]|nr:hypothetical protein KR018_007715 [Drosophila ironensis]